MTADPDVVLPIAAHARGSVLAISVIPRAASTGLEQLADGTLRVRLAAPPVDGAANAALLRFLADALGLPRTRLTISSGMSSRCKRILVAGVKAADLHDKVQTALRRRC